jgi:hypothetical protein
LRSARKILLLFSFLMPKPTACGHRPDATILVEAVRQQENDDDGRIISLLRSGRGRIERIAAIAQRKSGRNAAAANAELDMALAGR